MLGFVMFVEDMRPLEWTVSYAHVR